MLYITIVSKSHYNSVVSILWMRKLELREVMSLPRVTQLINGRVEMTPECDLKAHLLKQHAVLSSSFFPSPERLNGSPKVTKLTTGEPNWSLDVFASSLPPLTPASPPVFISSSLPISLPIQDSMLESWVFLAPRESTSKKIHNTILLY